MGDLYFLPTEECLPITFIGYSRANVRYIKWVANEDDVPVTAVHMQVTEPIWAVGYVEAPVLEQSPT